MPNDTQPTWSPEDIDRWDKQSVDLVTEFVTKSPSIGKYQATLHNGARLTIEAPGQWSDPDDDDRVPDDD
jgi:hypothetical protein